MQYCLNFLALGVPACSAVSVFLASGILKCNAVYTFRPSRAQSVPLSQLFCVGEGEKQYYPHSLAPGTPK